MTVFLNNTLALVNSIFPKRENRDYCDILREAAYNCIHKNYSGHPPCKEIYKLFTLLECSSKEVKFLNSDVSKSGIQGSGIQGSGIQGSGIQGSGMTMTMSY